VTEAHFEQLAPCYVHLRGDAFADELTDRIAAAYAVAGGTVLDVGCGPGHVVARLVDRWGVAGTGVDRSTAMIGEARRAFGDRARFELGDVTALPFEDGAFDTVLARMVVHLVDREAAFAEVARVLRPGGRLVASSHREDNVAELWELIEPGIEARAPLSFGHANGEELLRASFGRVERRDVDAELVFPDAASMRTFVAATIDRAHLAPKVPQQLAEPFRATTRHVVFVAEEPRAAA
jgi:SAM-dependent methyltransferase